MAKELDQKTKDKYDKVLKDSSVDAEIKNNNLSKEEKKELKAYAIHKAIKLKKYVRN